MFTVILTSSKTSSSSRRVSRLRPITFDRLHDADKAFKEAPPPWYAGQLTLGSIAAAMIVQTTIDIGWRLWWPS